MNIFKKINISFQISNLFYFFFQIVSAIDFFQKLYSKICKYQYTQRKRLLNKNKYIKFLMGIIAFALIYKVCI